MKPRTRIAAGVAAVLGAGAVAGVPLLGADTATRSTGASAQAGPERPEPPRDRGDEPVLARAAADPGQVVEQVDPTAPLPQARPKVVTPVAGASLESRRERRARRAAGDEMSLPVPNGPATRASRRLEMPIVRNLRPDRATALPNGIALPPLEAPEAVLQVIRAGNTIARAPYKWGGGHGRFKDDGYDCSGSVSYALYAAGLIEGPRTSGQLETWGRRGRGRWITVYANDGHTFMEVAGIRFDTSGARRTGSRWQDGTRSAAGYVLRHPPGL